MQQMLQHSKGSKYAYDVLLPEGPISKSELKWQEILNIDNVDWEKVYLLSRVSTAEAKLWNIQYKMLRYILPQIFAD